MITGSTRLYAIIGDPIAHVRTPMSFNAYFAEHRIDAVCLPFHIGRDDLARGWQGLSALLNLDGFIVTAPHKQEAARLCNALVDHGRHVGVVNTVRREPDGTYCGTLLDGRGFVAGLRSKGHDPAGARIYIAGAGGAGNALAFALAASGASAISIHNRTRSKAADLVERIRRAYPQIDVSLGTADASGHDIAVNATSLGLEPNDPFSFDLATVSPQALVAEVIMIPKMTPLLRAAEARGHPIHHGTLMLDGQLNEMMEFFGLRVGDRQPAEAVV
ncbi:MAG: shikimate 5-dehydrogenase [Beijerinckiaceae bacterium]